MLRKYFCGRHQNNTIRQITPSGDITTLAGTAGTVGRADGTGAAARFSDPTGVAADNLGNVYVVDSENAGLRKIVVSTGVVTTIMENSWTSSREWRSTPMEMSTWFLESSTISQGYAFERHHDTRGHGAGIWDCRCRGFRRKCLRDG